MSSVYQQLNLDKTYNDRLNLNTLLNGARCIQFDFKTPVTIDSSWSTDNALVGRNTGSNQNEIVIWFQKSVGTLRFLLRFGATTYFIDSDVTSWTSDTWYNVTCQIDASNGMEMYVNGVKQTDTEFSATGAIPSIADDSFLGCFGFNVWQGDFSFKNVKIWNVSKTSGEISTELNYIPTASDTGLIEALPFLNETGATTTGVKGNTGTISTLNAGGVTYVDNVVRELINPPEPGPAGPTFNELQIRKVSKQLYPTGRAYNQNTGTVIESLHNALSKSESQAFEDAKGVLNHILPDNANFLADDAALWENRLGLITNTAVSLADRKLAIQRKMNQPGEYPAKQSADYLEEQLQAAGFSVYVHENIPEVDIYNFLITNNTVRFGPNRMGTFRYNSTVPNYNSLFDVIRMNTVRMGAVRFNQKVYLNKVANHIEEYKDAYFPIYNNFRSTFFIGGITKGDFANVTAARKEEFRQLILKIKPVQTIGYLLINYV